MKGGAISTGTANDLPKVRGESSLYLPLPLLLQGGNLVTLLIVGSGDAERVGGRRSPPKLFMYEDEEVEEEVLESEAVEGGETLNPSENSSKFLQNPLEKALSFSLSTVFPVVSWRSS